MITLKTKELLNDPIFMEIKLNTVKQILGFNILNIESELDIYLAVEKYSKAYGKENGSKLNSAQNDEALSSSFDQMNVSIICIHNFNNVLF